jgi:nitrogen-specific signal transduction histidine kinase
MLFHFGHVVRNGRSRHGETELAKVLFDATEPVVVTDDAHRILAANTSALMLFGVSAGNLDRFAIDAFLPSNQVHYFERNGPRFVRSAERVGECEIRPLVGKPKVVEFSFQANFTLGSHVSKFHVVAVRQSSCARDLGILTNGGREMATNKKASTAKSPSKGLARGKKPESRKALMGVLHGASSVNGPIGTTGP